MLDITSSDLADEVTLYLYISCTFFHLLEHYNLSRVKSYIEPKLLDH